MPKPKTICDSCIEVCKASHPRPICPLYKQQIVNPTKPKTIKGILGYLLGFVDKVPVEIATRRYEEQMNQAEQEILEVIKKKMPKEKHYDKKTTNDYAQYSFQGYNQCLSEIKELFNDTK